MQAHTVGRKRHIEPEVGLTHRVFARFNSVANQGC